LLFVLVNLNHNFDNFHNVCDHALNFCVYLSIRFIKGILNGDGNAGISPEHTSADVTKSKSDVPNSNAPELVALHQMRENFEVLKVYYSFFFCWLQLLYHNYSDNKKKQAEENLDCSLNLSQINMPGVKYKLRSTCNICGNSYRDVMQLLLFSGAKYLQAFYVAVNYFENPLTNCTFQQ
jgi:hypothetical protein